MGRSPVKKLIAASLICVFGVGILVAISLRLANGGESSTEGLESVFPQDDAHGEVVDQVEVEPVQLVDSEEPLASPLYLGRECPDLLSNEVRSDERCLDAIERDLMGKAAYVVEEPYMVPREGQFTYRTMFNRLQLDQGLVLEALAHPECRLLDGPIRTDLKESCNAEAFYRVASLGHCCRTERTNSDFSSLYGDHLHFRPKPTDLRTPLKGVL